MPFDSETLSFRVAHDADWSEIWPIVRRVVAMGETYMFAPDMTESEARQAWLFGDDAPRARTFVARSGDRAVGTAFVRPNQPGLGDHVANAAWMIDPEFAGRGIGRRFAEYVLDEARALGYDAMQFNAVVATNARAIALWESLGFRIVGTVPDAFRHPTRGRIAIHVMHRALRT